jgi:hypothetical protein
MSSPFDTWRLYVSNMGGAVSLLEAARIDVTTMSDLFCRKDHSVVARVCRIPAWGMSPAYGSVSRAGKEQTSPATEPLRTRWKYSMSDANEGTFLSWGVTMINGRRRSCHSPAINRERAVPERPETTTSLSPRSVSEATRRKSTALEIRAKASAMRFSLGLD